MSKFIYNSQGERIEILTIEKGEFAGQELLAIHDDPDVSNTKAYHLLDEVTKEFLLAHLKGH